MSEQEEAEFSKLAVSLDCEAIKTVSSILGSSWAKFVLDCHNLGFGEIEKLKIQNGVPVLAEVMTKKVKFS